jgi:hypothetical protein
LTPFSFRPDDARVIAAAGSRVARFTRRVSSGVVFAGIGLVLVACGSVSMKGGGQDSGAAIDFDRVFHRNNN